MEKERKLKMAGILENDENYGPVEFGYAPAGVYCVWVKVTTPLGGYKIHLSCMPSDAKKIAQLVLSI